MLLVVSLSHHCKFWHAAVMSARRCGYPFSDKRDHSSLLESVQSIGIVCKNFTAISASCFRPNPHKTASASLALLPSATIQDDSSPPPSPQLVCSADTFTGDCMIKNILSLIRTGVGRRVVALAVPPTLIQRRIIAIVTILRLLGNCDYFWNRSSVVGSQSVSQNLYHSPTRRF